ncbi:hypothetical protein JOB18_024444 [Solea senegalensis]|uniref:Uncharacterized protein n=1 Tax=Solea senegalensis TaxID=28829 RepID=A0AAV6PRN1_SOLSE|nr:hypothetical protein JOB18_024444 [Solea senegalensis]
MATQRHTKAINMRVRPAADLCVLSLVIKDRSCTRTQVSRRHQCNAESKRIPKQQHTSEQSERRGAVSRFSRAENMEYIHTLSMTARTNEISINEDGEMYECY